MTEVSKKTIWCATWSKMESHPQQHLSKQKSLTGGWGGRSLMLKKFAVLVFPWMLPLHPFQILFLKPFNSWEREKPCPEQERGKIIRQRAKFPSGASMKHHFPILTHNEYMSHSSEVIHYAFVPFWSRANAIPTCSLSKDDSPTLFSCIWPRGCGTCTCSKSVIPACICLTMGTICLKWRMRVERLVAGVANQRIAQFHDCMSLSCDAYYLLPQEVSNRAQITRFVRDGCF